MKEKNCRDCGFALGYDSQNDVTLCVGCRWNRIKGFLSKSLWHPMGTFKERHERPINRGKG